MGNLFSSEAQRANRELAKCSKSFSGADFTFRVDIHLKQNMVHAILRITNFELLLEEVQGNMTVWPFYCIRRYGVTEADVFFFETSSRRNKAMYCFHTSNAKTIFHLVRARIHAVVAPLLPHSSSRSRANGVSSSYSERSFSRRASSMFLECNSEREFSRRRTTSRPRHRSMDDEPFSHPHSSLASRRIRIDPRSLGHIVTENVDTRMQDSSVNPYLNAPEASRSAPLYANVRMEMFNDALPSPTVRTPLSATCSCPADDRPSTPPTMFPFNLRKIDEEDLLLKARSMSVTKKVSYADLSKLKLDEPEATNSPYLSNYANIEPLTTSTVPNETPLSTDTNVVNFEDPVIYIQIDTEKTQAFAAVNTPKQRCHSSIDV